MSKVLTGVAAYGRKYSTEDQVRTDWEADKDFKVSGGVYFSKREMSLIKADGFLEIHIVYDILMFKVCKIKVE